VATVGCLSVLGILNLMSEGGIDGYRTASVLGYSLLPMVMLSILSALLQLQYVLINDERCIIFIIEGDYWDWC
jgi:hypothetical protein